MARPGIRARQMRALVVSALLVATPAVAAAQTVVVNEVMYRPWNQGTTGKYEFIELYNHGAQAVALGGLFLTDSQDLTSICAGQAPADNEGVFAIPSGVSIPAGGYLTFWHTALPGVTDQPGNVVYSSFVYLGNIVLNDDGDQVTVFGCNGATPVVLASLDYGALGLAKCARNVSLERKDPLGETQSASRWGFSKAPAGGQILGGGYTPGGTPGAKNTKAGP
ncbi:lamin tail domain-containing protein [Polyangium fumosum]|uniref:Lamin tail domain-containing protein n=1 Tax=Polyangium fumosum TaxID=889272 RepID=A0A4U1J5U0_9BACT|nr:lamin tail domain-containing protein [Polyangium fumosum]TKD02471.1 lamin tail domain-containing protein [Polyangium fumosum]